MYQFKLPDPGEGLVEAEIVRWMVAAGDTVKVNDIVVEIETSKSLVELPAPVSGVITGLLVSEGDTVEVGTPIITIDDGSDDAGDASGGSAADDGDDVPGPNLVGYGPSQGRSRRRRRPAGVHASRHADERDALNATYADAEPGRRPDDVAPAHKVEAQPHGAPLPAPGTAPRAAGTAQPVHTLAKPPVRHLARQLDVDLAGVQPTGPEGTITRDDVQQAAERTVPVTAPAPEAGHSRSVGADWREPIRSVRKVTAQAMVESVTTHVHATEWITIDVTATMELLERLKARKDFAGLRVSPLVLHAKAVCLAMANTPVVNASWDEQAQEIVHHGDLNLGIAAATPRGLMVPNIKAAQNMSLLELTRALNDLVQVARDGKLQPSDYANGTFTITNVGVFGIDTGTPIINRNESAILCMGAIQRRPWVVGTGADERIEPRWVTTLALSLDHRLIDGEQASRFLHDVAAILQDPGLAMLY